MEIPVTFENHGQQMVGMFHTPNGRGPWPAVVFYHGFTGNRMEPHRIFVKMARALADRGIAALRFDFRCSGDSEGNFVDMTVSGEVDDGRVALDWVRRRDEVIADRVGVLGLSMGGAVAATIAGTVPDIKTVALWAAVARFDFIFADAGEDDQTFLEQHGWFDRGGNKVGKAFLAELPRLEPAARFEDYRGPVLIVHGDQDQTVPPPHADLLAEAAAGETVNKVIVEGADHTFNSVPWEEQVLVVTGDWFEKTL